MDLTQTLEQLYAHKQKLERALELLHQLQAGGPTTGQPGGKRRGRKSMPAEERQEVSARMKRYWAEQRKLRRAAEAS